MSQTPSEQYLFSEPNLFSQGVQAGEFTFVAQDARGQDGTVGTARTAEQQTHQCLLNLDTALHGFGLVDCRRGKPLGFYRRLPRCYHRRQDAARSFRQRCAGREFRRRLRPRRRLPRAHGCHRHHQRRSRDDPHCQICRCPSAPAAMACASAISIFFPVSMRRISNGHITAATLD